MDGGKVLVIRNVSMETSGVYTCRMASGEEYPAFVDVLGEFLGHNLYLFRGRGAIFHPWSWGLFPLPRISKVYNVHRE